MDNPQINTDFSDYVRRDCFKKYKHTAHPIGGNPHS
jgi:hypothetical protein